MSDSMSSSSSVALLSSLVDMRTPFDADVSAVSRCHFCEVRILLFSPCRSERLPEPSKS